jgi:hypothetical protein
MKANGLGLALLLGMVAFGGGAALPALAGDTLKSGEAARPVASKTDKPAGPLFIDDPNCANCGGPSAKAASAADAYPCCTKCSNCRLECVKTYEKGECTHWKYNCDCDRYCPCPK